MLPSIRAISGRALIIACAGVLASNALPMAAADPLEELTELNSRAWVTEPELLAEVYGTDGVHSATFYDRTRVYDGADEYWSVMWAGGPSVAVDVDLPAPDGEQRWANFSSVGSGALCVFWAQDDLIVRHDCVVAGITTAPAPRLAEPG